MEYNISVVLLYLHMSLKWVEFFQWDTLTLIKFITALHNVLSQLYSFPFEQKYWISLGLDLKSLEFLMNPLLSPLAMSAKYMGIFDIMNLFS